MNKVLVFDIFADYGFFKKNYTTMSPLSFSVPPRTAICGMIGAISGIEKEKNPEVFNESFVALKIINNIKKTRIPINLLKTTTKKHFYRYERHKPTIIEFLKDLKYRIYFTSSNNEIYEKLKQTLEEHKSFYTLSIGISELLADYEFVGEKELYKKDVNCNELIEIHSVIPKDSVEEIDFSNLSIFSAVLPNKMLNNREVISFREFFFEKDGRPIPVKLKKHYIVKFDNKDVNIVPM